MPKKSNTSAFVPALVMGDDVSALNVVRSLGRRGIDVYVMGSNASGYGAVSRYARFIFCEKLTEEDKVIPKLLEVSRQVGKKMVLICTSDLHVLFVSRNRKILRKSFEFVFPEHEVIERLMDKKKFYEFAKRRGFCLPKTFFSTNRSDLERIAQSIPYPCVVKPLYRTRYWSDHVPPNKKVIKASSPVHLKQELKDIGALDQPLILQEWIPGGDEEVYFCLAYLNRERKPLALFPGKKLRQYPSLTGVTSLAESIRHQELVEETLKLLNAAGCKGLCSVEFKYNSTDGSFRMTEPTVGRVDLQEGICTKAGLDIPFLAYQDALEFSKSVRTDYKTGIKWINEPFEFNAFLTQTKRSGAKVGDFFRPYQGRRSFALLAMDDPIPFLFFLKWIGKRGLHYLRNAASARRKTS